MNIAHAAIDALFILMDGVGEDKLFFVDDEEFGMFDILTYSDNAADAAVDYLARFGIKADWDRIYDDKHHYYMACVIHVEKKEV